MVTCIIVFCLGTKRSLKVIDGEAIIINLANGVYYSMDKVGALVWDLLQAGHTLEDVIAAVTGRYDVPREQAESNVQELVQELVQENLVVALKMAILLRRKRKSPSNRTNCRTNFPSSIFIGTWETCWHSILRFRVSAIRLGKIRMTLPSEHIKRIKLRLAPPDTNLLRYAIPGFI